MSQDETTPDGPAVPEGPRAVTEQGHSVPAREVTVRRAPKYRAFVLTGAALGALLALVLVRLRVDPASADAGTVTGYLVAALFLLGGCAGAVLTAFLERGGRSS